MLDTAPSRACVWIDRPTRQDCGAEIPTYTLTLTTTTKGLRLTVCAEHLAAAVVTGFAAKGVRAIHVERRGPTA